MKTYVGMHTAVGASSLPGTAAAGAGSDTSDGGNGSAEAGVGPGVASPLTEQKLTHGGEGALTIMNQRK